MSDFLRHGPTCTDEDCLHYRHDAVPEGPFDGHEPEELRFLLSEPHGSDPKMRWGDVKRSRARDWLTDALRAAGVAIGTYDHVVVSAIADDSMGAVQAVAGWITQAAART